METQQAPPVTLPGTDHFIIGAASNADSPMRMPSLALLKQQLGARLKSDPGNLFRMPIRFYGIVLDQDERPVADANVQFEWNKLVGMNRMDTGHASTRSDAGGRFSLEGERSNGLSVHLQKPGYYDVPGNPAWFDYAERYVKDFYIPDVKRPVVFHLRRRGKGAELITSQNGIRSALQVAAPADGLPIKVDFLQKTSGAAGALEIRQKRPFLKDGEEVTEWSFGLRIPGGGFVEQHDQFPFEAPESGYQEDVEYVFQKGQKQWATEVNRDFYICFGNPRMFGRLHVETSTGAPAVWLTYAINPDGTRNLEGK